jgi:chemotaxis-related protein WspB
VLKCEAAGNRFALDARQVVEVVPRIRLQVVAGAPAWLAGACIYRGAVTPVVDLARLVHGTPCPNRWSSRVVLVRFDDSGSTLQFGLIVEKVVIGQLEVATGTKASAVAAGMAQWGSVLLDDDGMFHLLDLTRLLTPEQRLALAPGTSETA